MQFLRNTLELRQRFLKGDISADAVAPALWRTELMLDLDRVERELRIVRERLDSVRQMVSVGLASQLDLKRLEIEHLEIQLELTKIRQEPQRLSEVVK